MTKEVSNSRVYWRKGKRTLLCPLELSDLPVIYRGINDPDSYQYLAHTLPKGPVFEEEWIKKVQAPSEKEVVVAVCTLEGELIGTMGLHLIDYLNRTAITGSVIFEEKHRGQGYGTDAKMVLLDYAFNFLGLEVVESRVIGFNDRSAAYSRKCGYKEEARLRSRFYRFGQRHDEIVLSVVRDEWLPLWEEYKKDL
ncbi:MAG: GNAT family N-acetyltransferase [Candidatus Kaiserbacteria bacterium]|nr:GNAT family N-acetyltransferase [Candidatus Kaiserbacteria bacterium]MCB9816461.1 GNAT family N-acetyltransferase [Candidatus Nomurabacteria bacterium]